MKNGAEINFGIKYGVFDSIVNFRNDNGSFTFTGGQTFVNDGATMKLENDKLILYVHATSNGIYDYQMTLDAQANGSYTVQMVGNKVASYTGGNIYIQSLQINGTSLPILEDKVIGSVYNITLNGNTYPVEFDSNGNLTSVNGTALDSNGNVTLDGTEYTFSGTKDSITYEEFTDITKTKTIDGVEVTFTFDGSGVLQSVTGEGVTYKNGKITVGGKTYTVTLENDDVTVEEVNANSHLFENDEDAVKILATPQEDTITNSGDNVTINAQSGKDIITNSGANVSIYGGAGDDTIKNTGGNVTINAGTGNDSITNGGENVSIYGSFGDDTIENTAQSVTVNGYCGNDSISNSGASVSIYGGIGNDTIINSGSNVTINGGIGADYITNDGDNVSISLAAGDDTIENTGANVLIYGGSGKNKIVNNGGASTIIGGSGNEEITGGSQADSLVGNLGNDTLFGGAGNDTLTGGSGRDLFIFESGNDTITDYESNDKIQISSGTISETSFNGNDVILKIGNGSLTVQNGKGKKIKFIDSSGNTTTQTYTESNVSARTLDILYDNNFITDDAALDDITEQKYTVTEIQTTETDELNQPVISYSDKK